MARLRAPWHMPLVRIPDEFRARSRNVWGTRRVALCPTMRTPTNVTWDREIVYECKAAEGEEIRSVLMTPLATGVGRVSPEKWASQTVLAINHFVQASENPERWSKLDWADFDGPCEEVAATWRDTQT
ncbi:hypothetical protein K4K49_002942 [Colletotrichum sp. SAR 10_70]|nr:hypothetical protein K4K50_002167 [Colletotrichum sp. SAR 10_71]KAI8174255.1 hypothetical protein K4K49_002942 [Colletotrichum sp. SAR 10_70]